MAKYLPCRVYLRFIWNNASQSLVYEDPKLLTNTFFSLSKTIKSQRQLSLYQILILFLVLFKCIIQVLYEVKVIFNFITYLRFRGTFLVAQWLRIRLPMQGTRVQVLVQKYSTCHGATKPVRHNYWACTPKPVSHNYWACALEPTSHKYWALVPQLLKPVRLEPVLHNKRSHRNKKHVHRNEE